MLSEPVSGCPTNARVTLDTKMRALIFLTAVVAMALANKEDLEKILNDGNKKFTAQFFSEALKEVGAGKSAVMSAFSVIQPLAQLSLASVGESHDQLLNVIGLPNDNVTKQVFPLINADLQATKGVELKMANKIYIPRDKELNEAFSTLSKNIFGSEVQKVDFAQSALTAQVINKWVEDQTNKRIKDLVTADSLDASTRAVLVNALYFKGSWAEKFDEKLTKDRDFHVTKDKAVKLPTMFIKSKFQYAESQNLDAKLLELPYTGKEASMLIVLPNQIDGLPALLEKLKDPSALDKAVSKMDNLEVNVFLPKFKIETTLNLKNVLSKIGVTNLFDSSKARLDNLLNHESDLYVSNAIQKAFIEVNEEGAEAAAANAFVIGVMASNFDIPKYIEFEANRPFYYAIKTKGFTLFNGVKK